LRNPMHSGKQCITLLHIVCDRGYYDMECWLMEELRLSQLHQRSRSVSLTNAPLNAENAENSTYNNSFYQYHHVLVRRSNGAYFDLF
jgi:hypothetical protein